MPMVFNERNECLECRWCFYLVATIRGYFVRTHGFTYHTYQLCAKMDPIKRYEKRRGERNAMMKKWKIKGDGRRRK